LSLNLYTYCYNDPIDYFDPSGHLAWGDVWSGIKNIGNWFKSGWDSYQEWGDRAEAENALKISEIVLKARGITPKDPAALLPKENKKVKVAAYCRVSTSDYKGKS